MIPFACNFAFSLWEKKYLQLRFSFWIWFTSTVNLWTLHTLKEAKSMVIFWLALPPSMILLMPSECYLSFLCFFFLSLSSLDPSEVEVGVTGRRPSCWGYCSGQGGPSSSGCRLLHRWRCGYRAASPPAWHRHQCYGRWTAWHARCWKSAWARGRLISTPGDRDGRGREDREGVKFLFHTSLLFFVIFIMWSLQLRLSSAKFILSAVTLPQSGVKMIL